MYPYLFVCVADHEKQGVWVSAWSQHAMSELIQRLGKHVRTSSCHHRQECGLSVKMGACTRLFLPVLLRDFSGWNELGTLRILCMRCR